MIKRTILVLLVTFSNTVAIAETGKYSLLHIWASPTTTLSPNISFSKKRLLGTWLIPSQDGKKYTKCNMALTLAIDKNNVRNILRKQLLSDIEILKQAQQKLIDMHKEKEITKSILTSALQETYKKHDRINKQIKNINQYHYQVSCADLKKNSELELLFKNID